MNIIVRFYWQHDLDLVALAAHPEFDTAHWIKQALIAEVRGRRDFTIPLPSSIPYSVDLESNYVFFTLYMDEDEDIIHYLNGLRTGFRNSAIKIIFRKYLENPFLDVFFNENTYRTKSRGHAASANRRRKKSLVAKTLERTCFGEFGSVTEWIVPLLSTSRTTEKTRKAKVLSSLSRVFYSLCYAIQFCLFLDNWLCPSTAAAIPAAYPLAHANVRLYPPHMPSTSRISPAK